MGVHAIYKWPSKHHRLKTFSTLASQHKGIIIKNEKNITVTLTSYITK